MADNQILSVGFKVDTGSVEADAAAAGKLAAQAFQSGFGALYLKTPFAKAAEAAQAQTGAIGKALQAAMQPAAPAHAAPSEAGAGSPQPEKPKPELGEKPEFFPHRQGGAKHRRAQAGIPGHP